MSLKITNVAAARVVKLTKHHLKNDNQDLVPVILWFVGDTSIKTFTHHLGLGFIEKSKVSIDRLICKYEDTMIFNHLPEHILNQYIDYHIDIIDGEFAFVKA